MKKLLSKLLCVLSPQMLYALKGLRFHQYCRKKFGKLQSRAFEALYGNQRDLKVLSGPFQGLRYYNRTVWGSITPKWIGSYEEELHPVTEHITKANYACIIDVGAAEGYYAVGLAWSSPNTPVIAFDIDPIARIRQKQLAELNHINNLRIEKECSHSVLHHELSGKQTSLVICDIEGFEILLLDPGRCPILKHHDLLVELHTYEQLSMAEVKRTLLDRFTDSHEISVIQSRTRDLEHYRSLVPELANLSADDQLQMLEEHRPEEQEWLWMQSKKAKASTM